jgi:hypothetical protein
MRYIALALLLSGCAHAPEVYSASCVALDLITTSAGLERGYEESNPIYPDEVLLTSALVALGAHLLLRWVDRSGAWWGYGSARCAAGLYNWNYTH